MRGGEVQLWLLANGLRDRGIEVVLIARGGSQVAARFHEGGFAVDTFSGRCRTPWGLVRLRNSLRAIQPDVLWMNDSHALTAAGLASRGLSIPLRVAARRVMFVIRGRWQYRMLTDAVIANSNFVAQQCRVAGLTTDRIRVVYDGVPASDIGADAIDAGAIRSAIGVSANAVVLITVAALTAEKGHAVLLNAVDRVRRSQPGVCLLLAGEGPLRSPLADQAAELGLSEHVRFLGQRRDVPSLIRAADLFVMPSLAEGLCTAALEAQLACVPLVTTTAGGLAEVAGVVDAVERAENRASSESSTALDAVVAYTARPGDAESLAAAILRALGDHEGRLRLARRAKERAEKLFTVDRMVDGTLSALTELLAARSTDR